MSMVRIDRLTSLGDRQLRELCDVLIDCVQGGASVSFMLPITRATADAFWREVAASAERGERTIVVAEVAGHGPRCSCCWAAVAIVLLMVALFGAARLLPRRASISRLA